MGILIYVAGVGLAFLGSELSGWWFAPISVLLIAGLQNHLLILFHEGSHWLMHPNDKTNDFWTDLLCGAPLFQYVRNYRLFHWTHHRETGVPGKDPELEIFRGQDWDYARRPPLSVAWMLFKDLFLINLLRFQTGMYRYLFRQAKEGGHLVFAPRDTGMFLLFWVPVGALATWYGLWLHVLVFWLLPLFTVTFLLLKLHVYGEHTGLEGPTEFEKTWFHDYNPIVDFFIYPIRSGYHLEHHLFPNVPWYNMKRFRQELLKNPYYAEQSKKVWSDGFFFGERSIMGRMVVGTGRYTEDPDFQKLLRSRKRDLTEAKVKELSPLSN